MPAFAVLRAGLRIVEVWNGRQTSSPRSETSRANRSTPSTRTKSRCSRSRGASTNTAAPRGGGGGAGKATFQDLAIVHTSTRRRRSSCRLRHGQTPQGRDHHPSQGRQGPAGIPHRQDERRHHHRRRARRQRRPAGSETVSWRSPRSTSSTSRRSPTARSTPAFTSSTTSRPTK